MNGSSTTTTKTEHVLWARAAASERTGRTPNACLAVRVRVVIARHASASRFRLTSVPSSPIPVTIDTFPRMDNTPPSLRPSLTRITQPVGHRRQHALLRTDCISSFI